MATVNERFAEAVKRRLNGRGQGPAVNGDVDCLARARQMELDGELVAAAAAEALGVPFVGSLTDLPASHDFLATVPIGYARDHGLIGLRGEGGQVLLAMADPAQWPLLTVLGKALNRRVQPVFAPRGEIVRAINAAYQQQTGAAQQVIEQMDRGQVLGELDRAGGDGNEDLLDVASRAPVIKLVNLMLFEAVRGRASDVHVQPYEDELVVRFRIDGVLHDAFTPPKALQEEIISRIKVMAAINIAERRLAQDGRATVEVGDRLVDLRIATLPTSYGERVVIRLLDKSARLYELTELGMDPRILESFRRLIHSDHGIILVTGPTGSGKTTTLYSALRELDAKELNILTLEDPIEYRLEGISQSQVSDRKGMTFASGLRHVLRQDPDVIMVGEIRDGETAHMAIQSALTGHLVFSTLHTNDAAGAVSRLLDLGAEPYLVASCLLAVLAQRLVRRICPQCKQGCQFTPEDLRRWDLPADGLGGRQFYRGAGCKDCFDTGFRERIGIFELLEVTEAIREQVLARAKSSTIKSLAVRDGMTTLRADGIEKSLAGTTTLEEVARVTGRDEF